MASNQVVIGVDGGTTAVKAVAFDLGGEVVAVAHRGMKVQYGRNNEAEQDMDLIWQGVADCLRDVVTEVGDAEILAVGLTGQGDGCWMIDADGAPVRRAATWMDGRAGDRVNAWIADGRADSVMAVTGTTTFPGLLPVLFEELREAEPQTIGRAASIVHCKDWLRFNLTGERLTDYTEASRSFLDVRDASGYSQELAKTLALTDLLPLMSQIKAADAPGGVVSAAASAATGLPKGTPVGIGMIDVSVTGVGLGVVDDNQGWLILGTTGFVGVLLPEVADRRSQNSMVLATGRGKQVLEFLAPMTGTPNLDWIRDTLLLHTLEWPEIEAKALAAGPGSGGVVYLPYGSPGGERAPFQDTSASASWLGMSVSTTSDQILRSVYEGVAFSLVECVEVLQLEGDLVVSGGGFRSDLICQILADTTGQRVVRQDAPEAGARGAAVLALVSAGVEQDQAAAAAKLATGVSPFEPDPANREIYSHAHTVYTTARDAIRPVWPAMRELRSATSDEEVE